MNYFRTLLFSCLVMAGLGWQSARAATFTWDGGLSHGNLTLNDLWSTTNNWVDGVSVSGVGTDLVFTLSGAQRSATQNLAEPFTLSSMTFNSSSNVFLVSGGTLNFVPASGSSYSIKHEADNPATIQNALTFGGSPFVVDASGSGFLEISGNISSASGSLVKEGTRILVLSGNNSYTQTQLNNGILQVGSAGALGSSGQIAFNGGTLMYTAANQTDYSARFIDDPGQAISINTNGQNVVFASGIDGGSLTKSGAGTLTLTGFPQNDYLGLTQVNSGTLVLAKGNAAALAMRGDLSIGIGFLTPTPFSIVRLDENGQLGTGTNVTIRNDGLLDLNGHATSIGSLNMTGGELRLGGSANLTLGGNVTVNSSFEGSRITAGSGGDDLRLAGTTHVFTIARGFGTTYDLDVQARPNFGTIVKEGPGVLRLKFINGPDFSLTLHAGTVAIGGSNTGVGILSPFSFAGGTVVPDGGNISIFNPINLSGSVTIGASLDGTPRAISFFRPVTLLSNATLIASNDGSTTINSVELGSNTLTIAGANDLTIASLITGTGGLNKTGAGTLTLPILAIFGGGLTVSGGTVRFPSDSSLGAPSSTVTILNGGQLQATGSVTTGRTFHLSVGAIVPASGGSITYAGATVNGGTLGSGSHVLGNGTSLNGTRAVSGTVLSQSDGTVAFQNVFLSGTSTFTQAAGATLNTTGDFTANPQTSLTINGTVNTKGASISGAVAINGGGSLVSGEAPLFLDGSRGVTVAPGGTLVAASGSTLELGGLLVNNGTQNGVLHVNFGGFAKGSGVFDSVIVGDGGVFSPGNSPGAATVGDLSLTSGGTYRFELNSALATSGNGADFLDVLGQLDVAASPGSVFTISIVSLNLLNAPAPLSDFKADRSYSFLLATAEGGVSGFDAAEFQVDASGFQNDLAGGTFSVAQSRNDLVLNFTPTPEPGTLGLLGGGAMWLIVRRRRRAIAPMASLLMMVLATDAALGITVSGRVTEVDTAPVGGVTITIEQVGGELPNLTTTTAADGTWSVSNPLLFGEIKVTPSFAGASGFSPTSRQTFTFGDLPNQNFTATLNTPRPDIGVTVGATTTLLMNGTFTYPVTGVGAKERTLFTIHNFGTLPLTGISVAFTGPQATEFLIGIAPETSVASGGTTVVAIDAAPASEGLRTATMSITSNDPNESPFNISLRVNALPVQVTNTLDSGPGSLRQALANAGVTPSSDRITFAPAMSGQTIVLASQLTSPAGTTIVDATDLSGGVTIDGGPGANRLFLVPLDTALELEGVRLTGGLVNVGFVRGGAIDNRGTVTLNDCALFGNASTGSDAGAIYNEGTLILNRCTFTGNHSRGHGGAIWSRSVVEATGCTFDHNTSDTRGGAFSNSAGEASFVRCTFVANTSTISGGAMYLDAGAQMDFCTVAGNNSNTGGGIVLNQGLLSLNYCLVTDNISPVGQPNVDVSPSGATLQNNGSLTNGPGLLAPLGDYGGPTQTMALLPGSPARDGAIGSATTADQRGFPIVGVADIGAYEAGTVETNFNAYIWETLPADAPEAAHATTFDFDGDGRDNVSEWAALTDAANGSSFFVSTIAMSGGDLLVTFPSSASRRYTLQQSDTLAPGSFLNALEFPQVRGTGAEMSFAVPLPAVPRRFYRVVAGP